jgi:hypothetical protein
MAAAFFLIYASILINISLRFSGGGFGLTSSQASYYIILNNHHNQPIEGTSTALRPKVGELAGSRPINWRTFQVRQL